MLIRDLLLIVGLSVVAGVASVVLLAVVIYPLVEGGGVT